MFKHFVSLVIVFSVLSCSFAIPAENETKLNAKISDTESLAKSVADSKKDEKKFAAPLSEQENARTHFSAMKPSLFGQHSPRILPFQITHLPIQKPVLQIPLPIPQIPLFKPSLFKPPLFAPNHPPPVAPVQPAPPSKPFFPPIFTKPLPPVFLPPAISKPFPSFISKPTFVVSQQVIHKPVVTEKIEIIRRPVISEVVEVVHRPILSEVQQVIKHPTYIEHVVKKPIVTAIKNEVQGSPLHLPSQHYELHDKPQHVQPVTTEVLQIPHQQAPIHGSAGINYGVGSAYKPSYTVGSSLGGVTPSYGIDSGLLGLGSNYGVGSGYGSSYGVGSGYGPSYGSDYGSNYGVGEESGGIEHTYMVPAVGCKSNDGCRLIVNEDAINEMAQQSMYSPMMWYNSPSSYGKSNMDEFEQTFQPTYYYMAQGPQPDEQIPPEMQDLKIADFFTHPSYKPRLDALIQEYLGNTAAAIQAETGNGKLTPGRTKGKSNSDDAAADSQERKVKLVMDTVNTANAATLKEIEEKIKERKQNIIENTLPKTAVEYDKITPKANSN